MGFVDLNNRGGPGASGYGPVPTPLYRYLDTVGDGSGTKNAIGNYSASEEIFFIQPPAGQVFRIVRMIILIGGKAAQVKTDHYGSLGALATGVTVRVQNNGTVIDLTDGIPVKTNAAWGGLCYDSEVYSSTSNTDTYNRVRWTFERSGYPIRLDGSNNEKLEVVLNDDFTDSASADALTSHYFMAQGYIENTT